MSALKKLSALLIASSLILVGPIGIAQASTKISVVSTNTQAPYSTTTRAYLISGGNATTTLGFYTDNADQVDFNLILESTTTPPHAAWRYEYSENNIDWFSDDVAITTNATSTVHVGTYAEQLWNFASTTGGTANGSTTDFKHVQLLNLNTAFMRIVFYLIPGSPAANVWIQARTKSNNPI